MSDYRYAAGLNAYVSDACVIAAENMPDELRPDAADLVDITLIRDDDGQILGARVWDVTSTGWGPSRWIPA